MMQARHRPWGTMIVALIVACSAIGWRSVAADPERDEGSSDAVSFRRVYVPADRVENWPIAKGVPYKTIAPERFEAWIRQINADEDAQSVRPPQSRLEKAQFQATWDGRQRLSGVATFSIRHASNVPATIVLEPFNLALTAARWDGEKAVPAAGPAVGLDAARRLTALIDRSGALLLDWEARGLDEASGAVRFELALPRAPNTVFDLTAPVAYRPVVNQGVVQALDQEESSATTRSWRIELGGRTTFVLTMTPDDDRPAASVPVLVRQATTYDISLRGVDLTAELELDVLDAPLRSLDLALDPALRLVSVRLGEDRLAWTERSDEEDALVGVTVDFPEPVSGAGRKLRLAAVAPLVMDQPWKLPPCRASAVVWSEGSATLRIEEPLELQGLHAARARQTTWGPLADPRQGEALEFQLFAADAQVELTLGEVDRAVEVDSVASYTWDGGDIQGRYAADLHVGAGERFAIEADLMEGWNIASVDVEPEGMLADWQVDHSAAGSTMLLRFAEPLEGDRKARLLVTARRLRPALHDLLELSDLTIVKIRHVRPRHELFTLPASATHELRLETSESALPATADTLAALDAGLLAGGGNSIYYELRGMPASTEVRLTTRSPAYSARIEIEAVVDEATVRESTTLRLVPQGNHIERLLVQFSPPRSAAPTWQLGAADARDDFTARRLDGAALTAAGFLAEDEVWQIVLHQPRSVPFAVVATRSTERGDENAISLAALPQAADQTGTATILAPLDDPLAVVNRTLEAIPPDASDKDALVRATFRYGASDVAGADGDAPLSVRRVQSASARPAAIVRHTRVDSRYEATGGEHLAVLQISKQGARRMTVRLPDRMSPLDVLLDGRSIPRNGDSTSVDVPLDGESGLSTLEIRFRSPAATHGIWTSLSAPWPVLGQGIPELQREWRVVWPAGYDLLFPASGASTELSRPVDWSRRWFGLFVWRSPNQPARPWRSEYWRTVLQRRGPTPTSRQAEAVLETLGADAPGVADRVDEPFDWGRLVASAARTARQAGASLLVDRAALASAGIEPSLQPVPIPARSSIERGAKRLSAAGLMLLAHDGHLLLTTSDAANVYADDLVGATDEATTWREVRAGRLADRLVSRATEDGQSAAYIQGERWIEMPLPHGATGPGTAITELAPGALPTHRWMGAPPDRALLTIVHTDRLRVVGWIVFVVVLAGGWRVRHRRRGLWFIVALATAAVALFVPAPLAVVCSGLLAASLALLLGGIIRPPALAEESKSLHDEHALRPAATAILMALGWIGWGQLPLAYSADPDAAPPYEVLIPIDASRKPTGDPYQVPQELYNRMQQLLAERTEGPRAALLLDANYRGELAPRAAEQGLAVSAIEAQLDVQVIGRGRIVVPLDRDRSGFVAESVRLDGRPTPSNWNDDGSQLAVNVPEDGRYRLEFALRPAIESTTPGRRSFSLFLPPIPSSRLVLALPAIAPSIDVSTALAPLGATSDGQELVAELGPADRINVSWRDGAAGAADNTESQVEQLVWLHVRPGGVVVEARLHYDAVPPGVTLLEWQVDPRLRVMPLEFGDQNLMRVQSSPDRPDVVQFEFAEPLAGEQTLTASFLYTGASGVGNLSAPRIAPLGAAVARRWLAVSIDSALEGQVAHGNDVSTVDAATFLAAWGRGSQARPAHAFALSGEPRDWRLATQPKPATKAYSDELDVSVGRDRALVEYRADVPDNEEPCFHYELAAPPELRLDEVALVEDGVDRLLRWSRGSNGRLTLFLARTPEGPQQIRLRGWLPSAASGELRTPQIALVDANRTSGQVRIFRRPDVAVSVDPGNAAAEHAATGATASPARLGQLLTEFDLPADERELDAARWHIAPNAPQVELGETTLLRRADGAWQADLNLELSVAEGMVDELQFRVPDTWTGPYTVDPPIATIEAGGAEGRRLVTCRFHAPVTAHERLTIRSPLAALPGESIRAPRIEPVDLPDVVRHVVLPTRVEFEEVAWDTRGLVEAPRSDELAESAFPRLEQRSYRVVSPQFDAVLRPASATTGVSRVHLADIVVAIDAPGLYHGAAKFDLEPAGLSECRLELPEGVQLLSVAVDNVPAALSADGQQTWRILLHHARLPQRIEAQFAARGDPSSGLATGTIAAPRLGDLPVAQTLWTLLERGPITAAARSQASPSVTAWQGDLSRLAGATEMLHQGVAPASELSPSDTARWSRLWFERLDRLHATIESELEGLDADESARARSELALLDQERDRALARLKLSGDEIEPDATTTTTPATVDSRSLVDSSPQDRAATWSFQGFQSSLDVSLAPRSTASLSRYLAPAILAVAALFLTAVVGRRNLADWLARWPHFLGVVIGLVWWLCLWPSELGLLLALASAALALRVIRRPVRAHDRSDSRFRLPG